MIICTDFFSGGLCRLWQMRQCLSTTMFQFEIDLIYT